jgi:hypothetical protein
LSHALTSPGFTRAALTGSISSPDLTLMAAQATAAATKDSAAAAAAAAGGGGRGGEGVDVCMTSPVLLPNLRRLYLKLCLVPSAALTAMLGLPPPTSSSSTSSTRLAGQQQQQRPAGPPRTGCFTGGGGDSSSSRSSSSCSGRAVCSVRPPLEVLSVTGDGAARGEACEAWARWLDALKHLTALQVGVVMLRICCVVAPVEGSNKNGRVCWGRTRGGGDKGLNHQELAVCFVLV